MKRVVIYNLKECFEDGVTFSDLAVFEKRVQKPNDFMGRIELAGSYAKFVQAKINNQGEYTLYYNYITHFENSKNKTPF